jgi:peptide/nickel transport system permease protein
MTGRITGPPPRQITGLFLLDSLLTGNLRAFHDSLIHIVLPAFTLSLAALAQISRLLRASMIEQLRKDYTIVSRLMGMPETLNTYKYMLKNGITSSLTTVGLAFGYLLGNAFIIETVFDWPGMTSYGVTAVLNKDFNAIIGVTIIAGLGYLLVTFVMDLIYMYLDPRLRLERQ